MCSEQARWVMGNKRQLYRSQLTGQKGKALPVDTGRAPSLWKPAAASSAAPESRGPLAEVAYWRRKAATNNAWSERWWVTSTLAVFKIFLHLSHHWPRRRSLFVFRKHKSSDVTARTNLPRLGLHTEPNRISLICKVLPTPPLKGSKSSNCVVQCQLNSPSPSGTDVIKSMSQTCRRVFPS